MKITVRRGQIEVIYEEPQKETDYPHLINSPYSHERALKAIEKCVEQAMKITLE